MKKFLLLMSHIGSRWQEFARSLQENVNIDGDLDHLFEVHHPEDLLQIASRPHKTKNTKAVWLVPILHNHQISYRSILQYAKVIFFERIDGGTFNELLKEGYTGDNALTYINFRIRGMSQFARHCPEAPWFTGPDIPGITVSPEIGGHDNLVRLARQTSERYQALRLKWNNVSGAIGASKG